MTFFSVIVVGVETFLGAIEGVETLRTRRKLFGMLLEHAAVGAELEAFVNFGLSIAVAEDDGDSVRSPAHQHVSVEVGQHPRPVPYK